MTPNKILLQFDEVAVSLPDQSDQVAVSLPDQSDQVAVSLPDQIVQVAVEPPVQIATCVVHLPTCFSSGRRIETTSRVHYKPWLQAVSPKNSNATRRPLPRRAPITSTAMPPPRPLNHASAPRPGCKPILSRWLQASSPIWLQASNCFIVTWASKHRPTIKKPPPWLRADLIAPTAR